MLSRRFTSRERIMMLVLALVLAAALYLIAVHNPVRNSIVEAQAERVTLQTELDSQQKLAERLAEMQAALDEVASSSEAWAITPDYDNVRNVVKLLNTALANASGFDLRFAPVTFDESFAVREISMVFTTESYRVAADVIKEIANGPYSCDVGVLRIDSVNSDAENIMQGELTISMTVTYYEAA